MPSLLCIMQCCSCMMHFNTVCFTCSLCSLPEVVSSTQGNILQVICVLWSSEALVLVSAALDCTARVWQAANEGSSWICPAVLTGHTGRITCMHFCSHLDQFITGMPIVQVPFLNLSLQSPPSPASPLSLILQPICDHCDATGSKDGTLRVWSCMNWQCALVLQGEMSLAQWCCKLVMYLHVKSSLHVGPKGMITAIDVANKPNHIAASSGDGCCYIWNMDGRLVHRLDAQSGGAHLPCPASHPLLGAFCRIAPCRLTPTSSITDLVTNLTEVTQKHMILLRLMLPQLCNVLCADMCTSHSIGG